MLYALLTVCLFFWIVGMVAKIGGAFIHVLLALALCTFLINMVSGRSVVE